MPTEPFHVPLTLLAAAVLAVALCRRLNLSPVLGYLTVGALLGPHALGWLPATDLVRFLAELGVVFLLFVVGLEFSIPTLLASRRLVLGLGGAQVAFTTALAGGVAWGLGLAPPAALIVGGALAMSSTAVVIKQLGEQSELNTRHGRAAVAVLLFQDLATLPFLLLLPRLGDGGAVFDTAVLLVLAKGLAVFVLLAVVGRKLLRPAFRRVAGLRSPELFMLAVLCTVLGAATVAHGAGLSSALGAFLAGMVLSETEFRHQIEEDIRPFQAVLLGLFFATVGMALDPAALAAHWPAVLLLSTAILTAKAALIALLARLLGETPAVAGRVGLTLCAGGEFGLLLVSSALSLALLTPAQGQTLLAAVIVSIAAAPLLIRHNGVLTERLLGLCHRGRRRQAEADVDRAAEPPRGHVIVCGYGRIGQNLAELLKRVGQPYLALDLDPERVAAARAAGGAVVYGDVTRPGLLKAAGVERAAALVVTFRHADAALKTVRGVRALHRTLPVVARTRGDAHLDRLLEAGASEVLPEDLEASLSLGALLLPLIGVPEAEVVAQLSQVRAGRYRLLRRFFHGKAEPGPAGEYREQLSSLTLGADARVVGRPAAEFETGRGEVDLVAVLRDGERQPLPETTLQPDDVLVLSGPPDKLAAADHELRGG